ncbi:MAG: hypothetical protein H0X50_08435 [Nitrosopumilus sp.]|nr:hypothetical protein [Nitrosopumilus sp.]
MDTLQYRSFRLFYQIRYKESFKTVNNQEKYLLAHIFMPNEISKWLVYVRIAGYSECFGSKRSKIKHRIKKGNWNLTYSNKASKYLIELHLL